MGRPFFLALLLCAACSPAAEGTDPDTPGDSAATAGYVDSILPMDEAVRRFRENLPEAARLEGGTDSRDALIAEFIRAVQSQDTTALQRLLVSRSEYAYLYFPTSIYMNKPYELAPALTWFLNVQNSEKGITRVVRRLGGHDLAFEGYSCAEEATEGENSFWRECTVAYRDPQTKAPVTRRIFGTIMERDGMFKFLTYANDF